MMETKGVDEEEEHHESVIDWDSLLSAAENPELQEILRSPVEEAIHILNFLKTGSIEKIYLTGINEV
ncbi:unnamed protein product [Enterobius vermicularis]|uniref:Magnesium transporter n=1 Tax=Enterobius vermicularis TaxID=51028 RepID=A0A0N4UU52_ENTVE|nr:unnamed protein product [Enterobius vermicularis]